MTRPGSLPWATLAAWYGSWPWWLVLALTLVFTPLLFPTGRLLSPRWRPVAWLAAGTTAVMTALASLQPNLDINTGQVIANPIGVAAVGNLVKSPVATALNILLRAWRRSRSGRWCCGFGGPGRRSASSSSGSPTRAILVPLALAGDILPAPVGDLIYAVPIVFLPVAAGIAILRYRLYDIDRLINRTLVYGLLTAVLAAVYAGVVLVLVQVSGGIGTKPPSWAVAGATLAAAALFQPARRRIQAAVDRRFNRRKYNTTKTIEAFSTRLRDQIDLDSLSTEMLAVVDQTMEPTRVSLWLQPSVHGSSGPAHNEARPTSWVY